MVTSPNDPMKGGQKPDAEVIQEVTRRIEGAVAAYRRLGWLLLILLLSLLVAGLALVIYGVMEGHWVLGVAGGGVLLGIILPIRSLMQLHADSLRLQMIPQMLRLADTPKAKALMYELIQKLIQRA